MTDPVFRCPEHGYVTPTESPDAGDAATCPECGRETERILSGERRRRLSKFVSGALRHFPEDAGLELDAAGWTDYDDLVAAVTRKYDWAEPEHVAAVVATDPKGRFERATPPESPARIRAAYGHSVDVDLDAETGFEADGEAVTGTAQAAEGADAPRRGASARDPEAIPDALYHGTAPENVEAILSEGLKSMGRQEVHLSETPAQAREVGRRHAVDPALLEVDAAAMLADGNRISKRGPETYTADAVPPAYLDVREGR